MSEKNVVKETNLNENPNVKKVSKVVGLVVEEKIAGSGKDEFKWNEYSIVVEVFPNYYVRCIVKPDSKQKQIIERMGGFDELENCPWSIK